MIKQRVTAEHPQKDKYKDKKEGFCLVTLEDCDYDHREDDNFCSVCPRSMSEFIKELVKKDIPTPWQNNVWERNGFIYRANGDNTVAQYESTVPEAVFAGAWFFRYMREIDPCTWDTEVKMHECPCAFALSRTLVGKQPVRVLWMPEVMMVMVYDDCMYQVIATSWNSPDEIRKRYMSGNSGGESSVGGVAARL